MAFETIEVEISEGVATVTLNRPETLNAFDDRMCDEFRAFWAEARQDDAIRCIVLRAAGDRAFSSGVDRKRPLERSTNVWSQDDPGQRLGPKQNRVWKPVVCAVSGMAAGGAFYWINESDIVIASDDATFFDPHVTYGQVSAVEPIGMLRRVPVGEVMRLVLLGLTERMSAVRALQIGLVSEVVERNELWERANDLAERVAAASPTAVQGTVRAVWQSLGFGGASDTGAVFTQLGNPIAKKEGPVADFTSRQRPPFEVR